MNKYLEKVAKILTDENKQVAKTFGEAAAVDLPASAAGAWIGKAVGAKFGKPNMGTFVGAHVGGGLGTLAAMKHSLHGKVKEQ